MISDSAKSRVAFASLVKMINLLGAELLVGKYREDIDLFEVLRARQTVRPCRRRLAGVDRRGRRAGA